MNNKKIALSSSPAFTKNYGTFWSAKNTQQAGTAETNISLLEKMKTTLEKNIAIVSSNLKMKGSVL